MVRVGSADIVPDADVPGRVSVSAGAIWDDVVAYAVEREWWGIENLSAIPGTMGGAVVQNIGAYGAVLSDTIADVTAYDTHEKNTVTFTRAQCAFGYRDSLFKRSSDQYIVLRATLSLSTTPTPVLTYKDLHATFAGSSNVMLVDIRNAICDIRSRKFPPLTEYGTAGSFFLNPIGDSETAALLMRTYQDMPVFELPEGGIKIPLGWFFEHVLKLKGYTEGPVEAWREQALVLVAHSGATATEVKNFAQKIIARAQTELKIKITPEVRIF
jgi:UDP-N-acetylmuramate dehydrogenase